VHYRTLVDTLPTKSTTGGTVGPHRQLDTFTNMYSSLLWLAREMAEVLVRHRG